MIKDFGSMEMPGFGYLVKTVPKIASVLVNYSQNPN